MAALTIKPGREKSLRRHHPWIFSGAIELESGAIAPGETVDILSSQEEFLAKAAYSPHSQIRARAWTFDQEERVDVDFFRNRIQGALTLRKKMGLISDARIENDRTACRLIHAESDGIPGLIVDRYANYLVAQFLSTGVEFWKETLVDILVDTTGIGNVFERSDADVRQLEGLVTVSGALRGDPPGMVMVSENGLDFYVDITHGHKTGFYLDQRANRSLVRSYSSGCDVLDCFCYSGGFSLNALAGGANSLLAVDASADALDLLKKNVAMNDLPLDKVHILEGDVFQVLRKFRDSRQSFDMIILDPPKFAQSANQAEQAARGYKDINLLAFKLLKPGGTLFTFSCSGGISPDLFQKIVAGAALDAGVNARIVHVLTQAGDHPVALNFPEGAYLKGLVCCIA
jgi:23S rRNA (cytosine1962-C5)-methyltransferase